ncbi:signal peptidase II [Erythrobacter sanguineus]|uniref:Lipoprotein signal peptidase n=1 Tax=Erythrobacter sanguineus TaxID=198312 RepID=A0A1M7T373_9SPHN|nr:signal peptidase II [Erythrobacter sanguineus]SHN65245.1 signal peptidase II . Aspartic peptidase. MEROPS family A08 [Erythrobacter sanguineus]
MTGLFTPNRLIGLGIAGAIAIIDQVVKWYVIGPLALRRVGHIDLLPFFDLTYTENRGISLGMLQATNMEMRWLLVLMTGVIALVVLVWMLREKLLGDIFGLALILGGALGNIRDRYDLGYVIDYADFHIGTFRPFLIFNIADAAITIGVVIILARSLFVRDKGQHEPSVPSPGEPDARPRGDRQDA